MTSSMEVYEARIINTVTEKWDMGDHVKDSSNQAKHTEHIDEIG